MPYYQHKILDDPDEMELNDLGLEGWQIIQVVRSPVPQGANSEPANRVYMSREIGVEEALRLREMPRLFLVKADIDTGDWKQVVKVDRKAGETTREAIYRVVLTKLGGQLQGIRTFYEVTDEYRDLIVHSSSVSHFEPPF